VRLVKTRMLLLVEISGAWQQPHATGLQHVQRIKRLCAQDCVQKTCGPGRRREAASYQRAGRYTDAALGRTGGGHTQQGSKVHFVLNEGAG
jgi:hypothetical protein